MLARPSLEELERLDKSIGVSDSFIFRKVWTAKRGGGTLDHVDCIPSDYLDVDESIPSAVRTLLEDLSRREIQGCSNNKGQDGGHHLE